MLIGGTVSGEEQDEADSMVPRRWWMKRERSDERKEGEKKS